MKVTEGGAERVWSGLIPDSLLEDIKSKCSTERELIHSCTDVYVKCNPYSSWNVVASSLYCMEETAAVEEVQSYLNPRGRFLQWVWFVVSRSLTDSVLQDLGQDPCMISQHFEYTSDNTSD